MGFSTLSCNDVLYRMFRKGRSRSSEGRGQRFESSWVRQSQRFLVRKKRSEFSAIFKTISREHFALANTSRADLFEKMGWRDSAMS